MYMSLEVYNVFLYCYFGNNYVDNYGNNNDNTDASHYFLYQSTYFMSSLKNANSF